MAPPPPLYVHLLPDAALPAPPFAEPFRAVVAAEAAVSAAWMSAVSDWLVRSGCLYVMAWGTDSRRWETAIDVASIEADAFGDIPDSFVMTTCHKDDSLSEVFWFCKNNAHHPTVELRRTLLLHIADEPAEAVFIQAYRDA